MKKLLCVFSIFAATVVGAEPLRVICFGDSITGDRPRQPYLHQYVKFSDMLQLMVEARVGAGNVTVLNRGWGGDGTTGALKRLKEDVLDEKPGITIILIGGNDRAGRHDVTRTNLTSIVAQTKAAGSKVLLLQYHVVPNPEKPEKTWHHLAKNNDLIAAVAAEQQVPVLDMNAPMQAALKTQPQPELANAVDGVHLNPGGELVFARTIFAKLVELGWIKSP